MQDFSRDTFVINSTEGKIERIAMYSPERIIDFREAGIYISIQDGSKYGFINFEDFLEELAPYLDDALFFVIWDHIISRYEIKNRELFFDTNENFANWHYDFEEYILDNYAGSEQIIAEFYVEKADEMILRHVEIINDGEDPKERLYELEDYEELVQKLQDYKDFIPKGRFRELQEWLKLQMTD